VKANLASLIVFLTVTHKPIEWTVFPLCTFLRVCIACRQVRHTCSNSLAVLKLFFLLHFFNSSFQIFESKVCFLNPFLQRQTVI